MILFQHIIPVLHRPVLAAPLNVPSYFIAGIADL